MGIQSTFHKNIPKFFKFGYDYQTPANIVLFPHFKWHPTPLSIFFMPKMGRLEKLLQLLLLGFLLLVTFQQHYVEVHAEQSGKPTTLIRL